MPKTYKKPKPFASRPHMPGYGILPADQGNGLLPWTWARQRLEKTRTYFLSTMSTDGSPHCMPVWGIWLDDALLFSTGRESRKARNLAANPNCVVAVDHSKGQVVLEGVATLANNDARLWKRFARAYGVKYKFWDMSAYKAEPFYGVHPRKVFGLKPGLTKSATRWTF